jgi:hypothetical protein
MLSCTVTPVGSPGTAHAQCPSHGTVTSSACPACRRAEQARRAAQDIAVAQARRASERGTADTGGLRLVFSPRRGR